MGAAAPIFIMSAGCRQKICVSHLQAVLAEEFIKTSMESAIKCEFDLRVNFQIALFAKPKERMRQEKNFANASRCSDRASPCHVCHESRSAPKKASIWSS